MSYYKLGAMQLRPTPSAEYFDSEQLLKGTRIEMEHTRNPYVALQIAKHHLMEHPTYYKALAEMERGLSTVNSRSQKLVERARVAGILDLPAPLPTIIIYFLLLFGAITWVKAGGF